MIYCENCGQKLEDDAAFCEACGHRVDAAAATAEVAAKAESANESGEGAGKGANHAAAKTPTAPKAPKVKRPAVIAGAVALVVVVVAIVAFMMAGANPISKDQLKSDIESVDLGTKGVVSSNYVNESTYQVVDLKINDQKKSTESLFGMQIECVTVDFSGTIKNDSFETTFDGQAVYGKDDGQWVKVSDPHATSTSTKPLKGVDYIERPETVSSRSYNDITYATSDFQSSLEGSEGAWTSKASQKVSYDMWFATDTATCTAEFTFSEDKGWQMKGNVSLSDQNTAWKLAGKTFEMQTPSSGTFAKNSTSTLSFAENDGEGLTADWTLVFTAPAPSSQYEVLTSLNLKGTASGSPVHEFGQSSFTVQLTDSKANATIECASTTASLASNTVTTDALKVDIATNDVWRDWTGTSFGNNQKTVDLSYATFIEKA